MNYALALSRKAEQHLNEMVASGETAIGTSARVSLSVEGSGSSEDERVIPASLEERALMRAVEEVWQESGNRWRPWAKNGRACRVGKIVLLVDSDTVVPEVGIFRTLFSSRHSLTDPCYRTASVMLPERWRNVLLWQLFNTSLVRFHQSRSIGVVHPPRHEDVLQVAHHYFENAIAYFTRRVNKTISLSESHLFVWQFDFFDPYLLHAACANGEVAPFVGHNAFV